MGFFDGLLGPLVTQAASARSAYKTGQAQGQQQNVASAMQLVALKRQQEQDAIKAALDQRTLRTPVLGDPAYTKAQGDVAGAQAGARVPAAIAEAAGKAPIAVGQARDTAAAVAPIHTQQAVDQQAAMLPGKVAEQDAMLPGKVKEQAAMIPGKVAEQRAMTPGAVARAVATAQGETPTMVDRANQIAQAKPNAGGSASNRLTNARARAGIAEMNTSDPRMIAFEDKLLSGKADISGLDEYLHLVGDDFVSGEHPLKTAMAMAALNKKNPELARYLRSGLSFAEAESLIGGRPSDFRTKMATYLSTAPTGAPPELIDDIRQRRGTIRQQLNESYPEVQQSTAGGGRAGGAGSPGTGAAASGKKTDAQLWDDAVKLHGRDKVIKEIGPRPPE